MGCSLLKYVELKMVNVSWSFDTKVLWKCKACIIVPKSSVWSGIPTGSWSKTVEWLTQNFGIILHGNKNLSGKAVLAANSAMLFNVPFFLRYLLLAFLYLCIVHLYI
jgi:hypothetical protein